MTLGFPSAPPHTTQPPLLPNIPNIPNIRRPTTLARRQAHKQKEQGKALPFNDMLGVIGGQAGHPRRDYVAPWMALHKPTWTYLRRVPERMTRLPCQQHPRADASALALALALALASALASASKAFKKASEKQTKENPAA